MAAALAVSGVATVASCGARRTGASDATRLPGNHAAAPRSPFETLDEGAEEGVVRRVHLARLGPIRFSADEPVPVIEGDPSDIPEPGTDYLVAESRANRVRIRFDTSEMRLLVWVNRHDLHAAVAVASGLAATADATAPAAGGIGLFADAGLPVVVADGAGEERRVKVVDPAISATGWLPAAAIGDIFLAGPARPGADALQQEAADERQDGAEAQDRPTHHVADGVEIRDRAGPEGRVLAMAIGGPNVRLIGQAGGGYQQIEYAGPRLTVRGFVPVDGLETGTVGSGIAGGGAFGVTHRVMVFVPAATCLFEGRHGDAIGRIVVDTRGPGGAYPDDDSWWYLGLWSPWGGLDVWVHEETDVAPSVKPDATAPDATAPDATPSDMIEGERRDWSRCPDRLRFR